MNSSKIILRYLLDELVEPFVVHDWKHAKDAVLKVMKEVAMKTVK
jgi:hypothetical protein